MNTIKKTITIHDKNNIRFDIALEITTRNKYFEFTATATHAQGGGQCQDSIKPANEAQEELIRLWDKYHLKNVSEIHNFYENLLGVIDRVQWEENESQKDTADRGLDLFMEEAGIDEDMKEACVAYLEATGASDLMDFSEAYQGEYSDDESFAQDLAERIRAVDKKAQWPNNCIDWERAAEDIMQDYCSDNGYYFRNL